MSLAVLVLLLALLVLVPVLVVGLVLLRGSRGDHFPAPMFAEPVDENPASGSPAPPVAPAELRGVVDVTLTEPMVDGLGVLVENVSVAALAPGERDVGQAFVSVRVARAGGSSVRVECEQGTMFVARRNSDAVLIAPRSSEFSISGERATLVIEALSLEPGKDTPQKGAPGSLRVDGLARKRDVLRLLAIAAEIEDHVASAGCVPGTPTESARATDIAADKLKAACKMAAQPDGGQRARLLPGVLLCALWQVTAGLDRESYLRAVDAADPQARDQALRRAEFARALLEIAGIAPTIVPG